MNGNKNNKLLYDPEEINRKKIENIYRNQNPYDEDEDEEEIDDTSADSLEDETDESENENIGNDEDNSNEENSQSSNVAQKAQKAIATAQKAANIADKVKKSQKLAKVGAFIVAHWPIFLVAGGILLFIFIIVIILGGGSYQASSGKNGDMIGLFGYDYLELDNVCEEITVLDEDGALIGTYDLETYVAGVISGEVASMNDMTTYEVMAIAARTYGLRNAMVSDCTMVSTPSRQVFREPTNEKIIEAANNTRGLVITRDNTMLSGMYDAFCWDEKDSQYYYMCQGDYDTGEPLKIPVSWAEDAVMRFTGNRNFLTNPRYQSHGQGISQHGTYYLSVSEGWTRDEILYYFFGSDSKIMSIYAAAVSGEYPIDPNAELYQGLKFIANGITISDVLTQNNLTLEEYNSTLRGLIDMYGEGTRSAVINFAVGVIGSLAEMGYKMNYQWGGQYWNSGMPSTLGESTYTNCTDYANRGNRGYDHCARTYTYVGFDCNGFVNWVLVNAFGSKYTSGLVQQTTLANTVSLNANSAVCQPGDLLVSEEHITIVIGIDEANKKYIIAHSTGSDFSTGSGGAEISTRSFNSSGYACRKLDSFYVSE